MNLKYFKFFNAAALFDLVVYSLLDEYSIRFPASSSKWDASRALTHQAAPWTMAHDTRTQIFNICDSMTQKINIDDTLTQKF